MNVIVCETLTVKRYHLVVIEDDGWQEKSIGAVKANAVNTVRLDQTDEDGESISFDIVNQKDISRVCSPVALQSAISWVDATLEEVKNKPVGRARKTVSLSSDELKSLLGEKHEESENHVD